MGLLIMLDQMELKIHETKRNVMTEIRLMVMDVVQHVLSSTVVMDTQIVMDMMKMVTGRLILKR